MLQLARVNAAPKWSNQDQILNFMALLTLRHKARRLALILFLRPNLVQQKDYLPRSLKTLKKGSGIKD